MALLLLRFGNELEGCRLRRPRYRGEKSPLLGIGEAPGGAEGPGALQVHPNLRRSGRQNDILRICRCDDICRTVATEVTVDGSIR